MFQASGFKLRERRSGFGLAETLIAIGVFSVIVSIAVGGFSRALRTQRQASALLLANSNASITIEQMTREMRTGYNFSRPGSEQINFTNAKGASVSYLYDSADGSVKRRAGGSGSWDKITADNVTVKYLAFLLQGEGAYPGDKNQPRVTIVMSIAAKDADLSGNVINLQTTISPRLPLDI